MQTVITGTGSFIPAGIKKNMAFIAQDFYDSNSTYLTQDKAAIISKFEQITGIKERRYAEDGMTSSDMAAQAAKRAIEDAGIDAEIIDQIIVAHNFGDVEKGSCQTDLVPSLASRVKNALGIQNPNCIAYDILFGCPGWLQGLIQAYAYCKAGIAKTCLVIGSETLSRVIDNYDRDSMIYSDGAGAVIVQTKSGEDYGILGFKSASYASADVDFINMGHSYIPDSEDCTKYLKMQGRKVYEFALQHVPNAIKETLDLCNIHLQQVKKIFIHQANEKMDEAIVKRLYKLNGLEEMPEGIMPMNIHTLGNSSVATVPTLYDMVRKGVLDGHTVAAGDIIVFASIGAGMNINALCYRVHA
jgi:3-oxoacyl-[acyl-carrier-protein] synthase-3